MSGSARTRLADDVRECLRALIDGVDLALATDEELLDHTRELEAVGRLIDAARVAAAGEVADRSRSSVATEGLAHRLGCRTPAELLERLTQISGTTARARIRTAQPLRPRVGLTGDELPAAFPAVADALASGALGLDAASAIVSALAPIASRSAADIDAIVAAETELVSAATGGPGEPVASADDVSVMARTWASFLDPDGTLPEEERGLRMREVSIGRERDGVVKLRGDLLPEVAAQLEKLLDAFLNSPAVRGSGPRFEAEPADADEPLDRRTPRQQRHDAFAGILSVAAGVDGMPLLGGAPPTLTVTVSADQLTRPDGVAFLPTGRLDDSAATPAAVARHVGCAGQIQRIVFDTTGRTSSSVLRNDSSPTISAEASPPATAGASSPGATPPRPGARSTTSTPQPGAAPHRPTTASCCAGSITAPSTPAAGRSG